jgi:predicted nucleic acid-binding protein
VSTLVDTNVLLRQLEPAHDHHLAAVAATSRLIEGGETLHIAAQSIAEFWAVATRPPAQNGLGFDVRAAMSAVAEIERTFGLLLSDEAMVYRHWKRLIVEHGVTGRRVFDARLVAVMLAHGVGRVLTFNGADFAGLGVVVLEPRAVASL